MGSSPTGNCSYRVQQNAVVRVYPLMPQFKSEDGRTDIQTKHQLNRRNKSFLKAEEANCYKLLAVWHFMRLTQFVHDK